MKFKLFILAIIAMIVASCSKSEVHEFIEPETKTRTMRFVASVSEPKDTRSELVKDGDELVHGIKFKWEENDIIQFSFVQGTVTRTTYTTVTNVSEDERTAYFDVNVPGDIEAGDFKIYAYKSDRKGDVTVGSTIQQNSTNAMLPVQYFKYKANFEDQAKFFTIWSEQQITGWDGETAPSVSLKFKHLGAMMTLHLKNVGDTDINGMYGLAFFNVGNFEIPHWVYNRAGNGGALFDLATGSYVVGQEKPHRTVNFYRNIDNVLSSGSDETLYVWFVPGPFTDNNNLNLVSLNEGVLPAAATGVSNNVKIAKDFQPGINYVYFAHIKNNPSYVEGTTPLREKFMIEFKSKDDYND